MWREPTLAPHAQPILLLCDSSGGWAFLRFQTSLVALESVADGFAHPVLPAHAAIGRGLFCSRQVSASQRTGWLLAAWFLGRARWAATLAFFWGVIHIILRYKRPPGRPGQIPAQREDSATRAPGGGRQPAYTPMPSGVETTPQGLSALYRDSFTRSLYSLSLIPRSSAETRSAES